MSPQPADPQTTGAIVPSQPGPSHSHQSTAVSRQKYECDACNKTFTRACSLKHKLIHAEQKNRVVGNNAGDLNKVNTSWSMDAWKSCVWCVCFIDLGCLYCKQTQRAFNVFKNTLNWLKIDSVDQKFNW
jgi:hypothetical protein